MGKVIGIANQKGGCGKTTVAINVASCLAMRNHSVLLLDADPQGSASDYGAVTKEELFAILECSRGDIETQVKLQRDNYDYILIDGAPRLEKALAGVIKGSDLIVIPCQPSAFDIWACTDMVDTIKTRQVITNGTPKARFLINGAITGSTLQYDAEAAFTEMDIDMLPVTMHMRTAYRRAVNEGLSVIHGDDQKAITEIEKLTTAILEVFDDCN